MCQVYYQVQTDVLQTLPLFYHRYMCSQYNYILREKVEHDIIVNHIQTTNKLKFQKLLKLFN